MTRRSHVNHIAHFWCSRRDDLEWCGISYCLSQVPKGHTYSTHTNTRQVSTCTHAYTTLSHTTWQYIHTRHVTHDTSVHAHMTRHVSTCTHDTSVHTHTRHVSTHTHDTSVHAHDTSVHTVQHGSRCTHDM
jgi:hypothetical protein